MSARVHALHSLALGVLLIGIAPRTSTAQVRRPQIGRPPAHAAPPASWLQARYRRMMPWGALTSLTGTRATAAVTRARPGAVVQQGQLGAASAKSIAFQIPASFRGELPKVGQTIFLSQDGTTAGFVAFPIRVPEANGCVGHGAGRGCFSMKTTDMQVSNTGLISGHTHVVSKDAISGFEGNLEVLLEDEHGNGLWLGHVGCWGVNMRSGRDEPWSLNAPVDVVLKTDTVKVFQYNSGCGDKAKSFFDELQAAAQAAGPIVTVVASII